jgi:hypothetical protein
MRVSELISLRQQQDEKTETITVRIPVSYCWRREVRPFGPGRSPARAGAGQHVEEQRRLQALITRGSSTRTSKSN